MFEMRIRRILCLVLAVCTMVAITPVFAGAATEKKYTNKIHIDIDEDGTMTSKELFEGYVYQMMYSDIIKWGIPAREKLSETEKGMYDIFAKEIKKIANGKSSTAYIELDANTLDSLNIERNFQGVGPSIAWSEFIKQFDMGAILLALISDMPYEMYWCDKTKGVSYSCSYYPYENRIVMDTFMVWFIVSEDYAKKYSDNNYTLDVTKTGATLNAVNNAKEIVEEYSYLSDYEKLVAYKKKICDLVEYNYDALNGNVAYGDPWQLIYVFDGDSSTKVVCEGYSKAFQYLCDLSSFQSDIYCISVSGTMEGGAHMWNIVQMDDGKNYMVDITNSDEGTIGQDGGLFLNGASYKIDNSYVFEVYYSLEYRYDIHTENLWGFGSDSMLNLSLEDYTPPVSSTFVKGAIKAYNPRTETKISLVQGGETKYTVTISAKNAAGVMEETFELTGVDCGTYDLVVEKTGHVSYTIKNIVVEDGGLDLTANANKAISTISLIAGDINSDDKVDLVDISILTSSKNYSKFYEDAERKEADINGDRSFDLNDLSIITSEANYNKSSVVVNYTAND